MDEVALVKADGGTHLQTPKFVNLHSQLQARDAPPRATHPPSHAPRFAPQPPGGRVRRRGSTRKSAS